MNFFGEEALGNSELGNSLIEFNEISRTSLIVRQQGRRINF